MKKQLFKSISVIPIMNENLADLIDISHFYGNNKDFVIAGGGNTSFKDDDLLYIKASGTFLATIDEDGFAVLNRALVREVLNFPYSDDEKEREEQIKNNLLASRVDQENGKRPSVETSLHELIPYPFVVHTHACIVNAILCSQKAELIVQELFGDENLFVSYSDPGYSLAITIQNQMNIYLETHEIAPHLIFLQNHGIFVSANTTQEIRDIYENVISAIEDHLVKKIIIESLPEYAYANELLADLPVLIGDENAVPLLQNNTLIAKFYTDQKTFQKIHSVFTPDMTMFCKSTPLFISETTNLQKTLKILTEQLPRYQNEHGYMPKVILLKNIGVITIERSENAAQIIQDVFEDALKISLYSENFGGPHFLDQRAIDFIEGWEVEQYRRKLACDDSK